MTTKEYMVDFGTWMIEAQDEDEARELTYQKLSNGVIPLIDTVIEND
jgi:hypothetical protein